MREGIAIQQKIHSLGYRKACGLFPQWGFLCWLQYSGREMFVEANLALEGGEVGAVS